MANTKISAFTAETDVANITGFAAFKTVGGSSTNVRISGSEIESTLNLSNFAVGTLAVDRGGTGQTSYVDGELLIGNTSTTSLSKATLTQGTDLSITNGNGSINIGHATISNTPGSSSSTLNFGDTFTTINSVSVSSQGHLTAQNTHTYTLPNSPTLPTGANPSATISGTVVNGSATTFMRSDAVPALGSTITIGTAGTTRGIVSIEGGSSADAQLKLHCSAGSPQHAITIEGPAHSGGNNYIVKLPTGLPAAGKVLEVDTYAANGGGTDYNNPPLATMKWADGSIYSTNGALTGARTVTMGSNNLTFASTTAGQEVKFEQNVEVAGQGYTDLYTGATIDGIDWDNGNVQEVILPNSATDFDPSNAEPGATYILILKQPASGAAGTINWGGGSGTVRWPGGTPPILSTANNAVDIVTLVCVNSNSTYYATSVLNLS
jgi:hypothetical protein